MKAAGRPGARAAARPRRGLGTLLALLGLVAVLGVTFTAGALAGRLSLRPTPSSAQSRERVAKLPPAPQPELTFYRELTAPLTHQLVPPKPTARPGRRETPPAEPLRSPEPVAAPEISRRADLKAADAAKTPDAPKTETARPAEVSKPAEAPKTADPVAAAARGDARYTIQVGAYNGRAPAEALKAKLIADGHDAYVAEAEVNGVTRYKVRIGAYPSHDEARKAAARLTSRSHVATYITTR